MRAKKFRGWRRHRRAMRLGLVRWFFEDAPAGTMLDPGGTFSLARDGRPVRNTMLLGASGRALEVVHA